VAQLLEHLISKCEALSSNPHINHQKKRKSTFIFFVFFTIAKVVGRICSYVAQSSAIIDKVCGIQDSQSTLQRKKIQLYLKSRFKMLRFREC
jgi:hypothetical protein